ncbi:MAG TPA: SIMPL domain-containing protein [Balneolaceae bacterium]|nr:SIMPL domain-containing protein [Balneolaceae bacterium]
MSYLLIFLSFLLFTHTSKPHPNHSLSVSVTGSVKLPADQLNFNINMNAEGKTPQAAYNMHKKREKVLVNLLDKFNIQDKNIHYEPVSISKRVSRSNNQSDTTYITQQNVQLVLTDFNAFEQIQIGLIQHHFDNFNAQFTSSQIEKGENEALKAAIRKAHQKAKLIADQAGVKLGAVQNIHYQTEHNISPGVNFKAVRSTSSNMLKYQQTITVSANISIDYCIVEKR